MIVAYSLVCTHACMHECFCGREGGWVGDAERIDALLSVGQCSWVAKAQYLR
jgi:hypothetical protein